MEREFQTSFIPKKPVIEKQTYRKRPIGLFTLLTVVLFFAVLIAGGGVYLYQIILSKQIVEKDGYLKRAKAAFEPGLIAELQTIDKRLKASEEVLANHLALSPLFETLQDLTLKTVRFVEFSYLPDEGGEINVKLSGQARSYTSVALQSDLLSKDENIKNPIFSNLTLDEKGNVLFDLVFSLNRSFLLYENTLEGGVNTQI